MPTPRGRILIVDGDPEPGAISARLLETAGHGVQRVFTGELALLELAKHRTDLVVLNVQLAGMPGVEVCRRIRQDLGEVTLPVIAVTASDELGSRLAMTDAGADDFFVQPVHGEELLARVRNLLVQRGHYTLCAQRCLEAELDATRSRLIADVAMSIAVCTDYHQLSESLRSVFGPEIDADFVGYLEYRDQVLELAGSAGGNCWSEVLDRVRASTSVRHAVEIRTEGGLDVIALPLYSGGILRGYLCVGTREAMSRGMRKALIDVTSHIGNGIANVRERLDTKPIDLSLSIGQLVAQDLAQPTQVLKASLAVLAATHVGTELDDTVAALQQVESMMVDLIDIARAEDGMLPYDPVVTHVRKLMGDALDSVDQVARRSAVRLQVEVAPDLSALLDPALMRRVLKYVVLNAIRHARAGGKVDIRATREGSELLVEVSNDGRAMAPEVREQFHRKFGAVAQSANVGVGLHFSKAVVAQHGGHIEVSNPKGGGARFLIHLPIAVSASPVAGPHGAVTMRMLATQRVN